MRKWPTIMGLFLAFTMTGCVPSLQPLFTDKDTIFEPALDGIWVQEDGGEQWVFSSWSNKTGYTAVNMKEGKPAGSFEAHLVQLGGYCFLDLYPAEPAGGNDNYAFHFVRAHSIHRIWLENDVLRFAMLDQDGLQAKMQDGLEIEHVRVEGGIVLTAPTADLQQLVVKFADDPQVFQGGAELLRKR